MNKQNEKTEQNVPESLAEQIRELVDRNENGPISFEMFCLRYHLDEQSKEARKSYEDLLENLRVMNDWLLELDEMIEKNTSSKDDV